MFMRTWLVVSVLVLAVCVEAASAEDLSLEAIRVRLFFNDTGTLSKPVSDHAVLKDLPLGEKRLDLNTMRLISHKPSSETLIDVIVRGVPGGFVDGQRVKIIVTDLKGATVEELTTHIGLLSESGRYYASFLLPDTGCESLLVTASLNESKVHIARRINFECSE
jgi:hypothetical protein